MTGVARGLLDQMEQDVAQVAVDDVRPRVLLDAVCANQAAAIREQAQVSVADAHIGATAQSAPDADITVVTSDPEDISAVCGDRQVTVVAI
jgi:predicted nucleic acid-binding protein